jgi:FAD/FMN-containing dehydrogenase
LLAADGRIVHCSRTENRELFALVLGGYGLFGIILDAELSTVPNERYRVARYATTSDGYSALFARRVTDATDVGMAYGRLSVTPDGFLRDAMLTVFRRSDARDDVPIPLGDPPLLGLKRAIFRGSVGSTYGKTLRWRLEKWIGEVPGGGVVSRNQLLNEPVDYYENTSPSTTDVLHEYFVPQANLETFLVRARRIIPEHRADLLNVTIRNVLPDTDTYLTYAREPVFGLVMLFNQPRTAAADDSMQAMTRELVDAAIDVGGTYYLPYRLHASSAQFDRAYPQGREFFVLKRRYDPQELFRNAFYEMYGRIAGASR